MATSEIDNVGFPRSETPDDQSQSWPLVSKWTPQDVEEIFSATKLCDSCRLVVEDIGGCLRIPDSEENLDSALDITQHETHEGLMQAVNLGCDMCQALYSDWIDIDSRSSERFRHDKFGTLVLNGIHENFRGCMLFPSSESLQGHGRSSKVRLCATEFHQIKDSLLPCSQMKDQLAIVRSWAAACRTQHAGCRRYRGQRHKTPTRLLYVDPELPDSVRLITTEHQKDYVYLTLSHRWGAHPLPEPPKLSICKTSGGGGWFSMEELQAGVRQSCLPKTFEEAVQIARYCGVNHIWIDSLCIIQDKDRTGKNSDWDTEAVKMCDIYAGGLFNIAAVNAQHSDQGLFPESCKHRLLALPRHDEAGIDEPLALYPFPGEVFQHEIANSVLLSRAWVFQEILLGPANLFCTKDQMWWSCSRTTFSGTFPIHPAKFKLFGHQLPFGADRIRDTRNFLFAHEDASKTVQSWTEILTTYARTSVTFRDDCMVALQGISALFRHHHPEALGEAEYHSGLWSVDVLQQLLWYKLRHIEGTRTTSPATASSARPIPTWSPLREPKEILYKLLGPSEPYKEGWDILPNKFVGMKTSRLDNFGRAADLEGCQMHLQCVLVSVSFPEVPELDGSNRREGVAWPTGHEDVPVMVIWDEYEEQALARETLAEASPQTQYRALAIAVRVDGSRFDVSGMLIRSLTFSEDLRGKESDPLWMRCGLFHRTYIPNKVYQKRDKCGHEYYEPLDRWRVDQIETAFQLYERYGLRWEPEGATEDEEGGRRWHQVILHDAELEDVYIV